MIHNMRRGGNITPAHMGPCSNVVLAEAKQLTMVSCWYKIIRPRTMTLVYSLFTAANPGVTSGGFPAGPPNKKAVCY